MRLPDASVSASLVFPVKDVTGAYCWMDVTQFITNGTVHQSWKQGSAGSSRCKAGVNSRESGTLLSKARCESCLRDPQNRTPKRVLTIGALPLVVGMLQSTSCNS
jgi:hypothetical protein